MLSLELQFYLFMYFSKLGVMGFETLDLNIGHRHGIIIRPSLQPPLHHLPQFYLLILFREY